MKFTLSKASQIKMDLYNGAGQQISRLSNTKYGEGQQFVELDLSAYPTGMYWIKLTGEGFSGVRKVVISE
ncbi:MAG TPA: T9SS type A sorting domain-containing protein [Saprospiraceae bacterium]|nr:T9SS type A sorting domain-containing protein [Saprospiraceae bacterium]